MRLYLLNRRRYADCYMLAGNSGLSTNLESHQAGYLIVLAVSFDYHKELAY